METFVVCKKLPEDFIRGFNGYIRGYKYCEDYNKHLNNILDDLSEASKPDADPKLYLNEKKTSYRYKDWSHWLFDKIGTKNGEELRPDVRNSYTTHQDPSFKIDRDLEKELYQVLSLLYPQGLLKSFGAKTLKKVAPYFFLDNSDSDSDDDNSDGSKDYEYQEEMKTVELLAYLKDGFFLEHTDSPKNLKFATTLIFLPSTKRTCLEGGDLVLKISSEHLYDPDSLFQIEKEEGKIRLKVESINTPVLVSFHIGIPHSVDEVTKGIRLCFKMSQVLPRGSQFFTRKNEDSNKNLLVEDIYQTWKNVAISSMEKQIDDHQKKIQKLTGKISDIENNMDHKKLLEYSTFQLNDTQKVDLQSIIDDIDDEIAKINKSKILHHLFVLETGPLGSSDDGDIITEFSIETLSYFKSYEVYLILKILKYFPQSTLCVINGKRKRFSHRNKIRDCDRAYNLCKSPGAGPIDFSFEGKIHYVLNPDVFSIGYRSRYEVPYNDETFSAYDHVLIYGLCILKK